MTWTKGRVLGSNKDGSLTIVDQYGKMRAIMPEHCQLKQTGPKGGIIWSEFPLAMVPEYDEPEAIEPKPVKRTVRKARKATKKATKKVAKRTTRKKRK